MYNFSADSSKTNIQIFDFSSQRHPIDDSTDAIYLSYTKLSQDLLWLCQWPAFMVPCPGAASVEEGTLFPFYKVVLL